MTDQLDVVIGVDAGTSGCKVTALSATGQLVRTAHAPYPTHHPHPGWAEQDPDDWVAAAKEAMHSVLSAGRSSVRAITFSAPHHVLVLLDADARPIRRAIMWTDQRSAGIAKELADTHGDLIWQACNNAPAATWTLPQLIWLRRHEPETLARAHTVLTMKDYLRRVFNEQHVTDHIDAAGTMLYDVHTRTWHPELLRLAGLPAAALPRLAEPGDRVGEVSRATAEELGLTGPIQVVTGSSDTSLELLSAGCVRTGDAALKLATAGNYSRIEERPSADSSAISYPFLTTDSFYLNSATNSAAASLEWFIRLFTGGRPSDPNLLTQLNEEAAAVPPGCDGVIFHPYLTGERAPHWNPALRGSFVGLSAATTRGHLTRAVMEGVALSLRDAMAGARPTGIPALIGGGSKSPVWQQIMADVMRAPLTVPERSDSSLGGALLCSQVTGWIPDLTASREFVRRPVVEREPDRAAADHYDELFDRYRRIQAALQPGYETDQPRDATERPVQ